MLCSQTHAWRQLPNEIKPRGEEKRADPSYLQAMNGKRETSHYQMGRLHIAALVRGSRESV